jgi:hypothetical protein
MLDILQAAFKTSGQPEMQEAFKGERGSGFFQSMYRGMMSPGGGEAGQFFMMKALGFGQGKDYFQTWSQMHDPEMASKNIGMVLQEGVRRTKGMDTDRAGWYFGQLMGNDTLGIEFKKLLPELRKDPSILQAIIGGGDLSKSGLSKDMQEAIKEIRTGLPGGGLAGAEKIKTTEAEFSLAMQKVATEFAGVVKDFGDAITKMVIHSDAAIKELLEFLGGKKGQTVMGSVAVDDMLKTYNDRRRPGQPDLMPAELLDQTKEGRLTFYDVETESWYRSQRKKLPNDAGYFMTDPDKIRIWNWNPFTEDPALGDRQQKLIARSNAGKVQVSHHVVITSKVDRTPASGGRDKMGKKSSSGGW